MKVTGNRILSIVVLLSLLIGLLAACKSPSPTDTPGPQPSGTDTPVAPSPTDTAVPPTATVGPTPTPLPPINPIPLEISPARGQEAALDGVIQIRFDQSMDQSSVEQALVVTTADDAQAIVPGSVAWPDERTLRFTPSQSLDRASRYNVSVGTGAKSQRGLALQREVAFNFNTVGFLQVGQVIPAPNTMDVAPDSTITVMFNRPVVPLTAVSDPARDDLPHPLTLVGSGGQVVGGTGEWLNTSIYVFTPDRPLTGGLLYKGTVSAGLTDTTGGVLSKDYVWTFRVAPPYVVWATPGMGKDDVRPSGVITVTFNQSMERAATERAFSLHWNDPSGPEVSGSFRWAEETEPPDRVMGFVPDKLLELESTYYAVVSTDALAQGGAAGLEQDYVWYFDTVPYPRIVDTDPRDGALSVEPGSGFSIRFSAPIDPKTVLDRVTILPEPTGIYTYWSDYSYRYHISLDSLPSTDYHVTIAPGISDPYGNTIDTETVVRYTTRAYSPMAWLNVPDDVGFYNGYDTTELFATYRNVSFLDLALYAMPLDNFLRIAGVRGQDRWQYWRDYGGRPENMVRRWVQETDTELNESGFARLRVAGPEGGALAPGIYYLELTAPELGRDYYGLSRHVLVVSKNQLTMKIAPNEALVWATDLQSGQPVAGLQIGPFEPNGTTDADGLTRVPFAQTTQVWETRYAMSGSADPFSDDFGIALSEWGEGISPWDFAVSAQYSVEPYRAYFYTDRPIYRPGQPVYFKGIVRRDDDARYDLPSEIRELDVEIRDDQGKMVYEETLPVSDLGTLDGEFTLDAEAALGYYYLSATITDERDRQYGYGVSFRVAEYRKPEFQVDVTTDRDQYLQDETVDVVVHATYFFGGPVADAQVNWSLLTSDYAFRPANMGRFDWTDSGTYRAGYDDYYYGGFGELIADGQGTTDAQGRLVFAIPADIADRVASQSFTIEATVADVNDQIVSGRASVIVHKGQYYAGLRPQSYVGKVGEDLALDVRTVDWYGDAWTDQDLSVVYNKRTWYSVREEDSRGRLYWNWTYTDTAVYTDTLSTDAEGRAVTSFVPEEGGSYIVRAIGEDNLGNEVRSATWVWVSSSKYVSWRVENNDRIDLIADQDSYSPGDTATVLIPSPFQAPRAGPAGQGEVKALLTVERGHILETRVLTLRSNSEIVEIPITPDMAPNAYVSVVLVKGVDETNPIPAFKVGYAAFEVSTERQELILTLTPDKDVAAGEYYHPKDTVTYQIRATDYAGNPAAGAEVSLNLTDLSVLSLAEPNAPPLVKYFYGKRGLGVRTATGLTLAVDRLNEKIIQEVKGGGGGALGADVEIRRDFPDTAYWAASVRTGENGEATVQVELPDSLTTWRLIAKAVTADTLVGEGQVDIISTKDLLVRPSTPRFFVVGDRARLGAVVHNNTQETLAVDVRLDAVGLTLESAVAQSVEIPAGGKALVEWTVTVPGAPGVEQFADLTFSASGGGYSDATKPTLGIPPDQLIPVYKYTTPEVVGTAGDIAAEGGETRVEAIALPSNVDTTQGELTVLVDPSLAAGMTEGLRYLEHYPYECTEQTVSRFLPNVLTYRALKDLDLVDPELESDLRQQVAVGLQRLYNNQHSDGGWGWWVNDESNPTVSAWVMFGLAKAQQSGFSVDRAVIQNGANYLNNQLISTGRLRGTWQANRQAFMLYVLAESGQPDMGRTTVLFENRDKLSTYARAYLALTFHLIDPNERSQIDTLLSDFNNAAILSATGAHWEEGYTDWWNWNTDTRSTAIVLDALARLDPENDLAPNAVRWLMVARTAGHWETTQETAWSLIALTDWMAYTGELQGDYGWGVALNNELLAQDNVTRENIDQETTLRVEIKDLLLDQVNQLAIEKGEGPGRLYYTAHLRTYLPVEEVKALNRGIIVGRQYTLASCDPKKLEEGEGSGEPGRTVCPTIDSAQIGETVRVKVTIIAPNDLHYVVVEDPLPAGAEAVDVSLKTTSMVGEAPEIQSVDPWSWYGWGWWWFSHSELRDEKAVLFATYLPAGTYEYTYLIRPGLSGEFKVLPTYAYEMYFPEVFGRGDGMVFEIGE